MKRVVHEASVWNGISKLDLDFSDPKSPSVTARDHDFAVVPESREGLAMTRRSGLLLGALILLGTVAAAQQPESAPTSRGHHRRHHSTTKDDAWPI